jgi:hypothetical protein
MALHALHRLAAKLLGRGPAIHSRARCSVAPEGPGPCPPLCPTDPSPRADAVSAACRPETLTTRPPTHQPNPTQPHRTQPNPTHPNPNRTQTQPNKAKASDPTSAPANKETNEATNQTINQPTSAPTQQRTEQQLHAPTNSHRPSPTPPSTPPPAPRPPPAPPHHPPTMLLAHPEPSTPLPQPTFALAPTPSTLTPHATAYYTQQLATCRFRDHRGSPLGNSLPSLAPTGGSPKPQPLGCWRRLTRRPSPRGASSPAD